MLSAEILTRVLSIKEDYPLISSIKITSDWKKTTKNWLFHLSILVIFIT